MGEILSPNLDTGRRAVRWAVGGRARFARVFAKNFDGVFAIDQPKLVDQPCGLTSRVYFGLVFGCTVYVCKLAFFLFFYFVYLNFDCVSFCSFCHGMPTLAYCATLNNYTADDVAILRTPNLRLNYLIVGHEVGAQGTPHLQIYFQLARQAKLTTIKQWGGPWARMHLESAKGSDTDNYNYCKKDGNFFELGERREMGRKGQRSDIAALKKAIDDGWSFDKICNEHFGIVARYSNFIRERIQARDSAARQSDLRQHFSTSRLRPWQQTLVDTVSEDPHPRQILWLWEREGNVGKSWMANYLGAVHGALVLTTGRKLDLAYIYAKEQSRIVIFDLARTQEPGEGREHSLDSLYSLAEDLKNGRVVSTKYDSRAVFFRPPHVIFLANFEPDRTKWSADRYRVIHIASL